ncbi:TonB-dependent receptor plug domain-containing protein [Marinimicrobium sp. C2-29]|uniref:TonB-dependent receptor plug domain-containing protein n=1 Tax=Marinimicrobium sp. C2-29 TaxID=3139825 RepID=UPI00313A2B2D
MNKTLLSSAIVAATLALPVQAQDTDSDDYAAPGLETLTVVSSRTETEQRQLGSSVSVLTETDIKALGFQSLADVLRTLPSVSVTNNGGMGKATSLRVRGEAGFRTLVRVDGVDISDPTATQVSSQVHHLLSSNVARVELLRGPQGMMYGADAGGVLDITTDHVDEGLKGGASLETGRYNTKTYSGHVGGGNERGDFYLSGARASTEGFNSHTDDTSGEADGYENTTFHARGGLNLNDDWRAQAVLRETDAESEFDRCGFPAIDDCIGNFDQRNSRASVTHTNELGKNTLAFSRTDVARKNYAGGEVSYDTEGEIAKWTFNGNAQLTEAHGVVYGLEQRTDQVRELKRDQSGVYLEYQGQYEESFFVTAGVRRDDNDDFGGFTSYRLSGAYLIPEVGRGTLKLKSSLGTGFRAPSLFEIDYNRSGDTPMEPLSQEESRGFDIGLEYFGETGLHMEAVLFDQKIDDEIYFDLEGFTGYLQGGQESESRGLELIAEVPLDDTLWLNANYTRVDAEASDGSPRSRQPKHLYNVGFRYLPLDTLTVSLNWRSSQDRMEGDTELKDYRVVDASVRYQAFDGVVVFVRGENILDEDYVEVPGYNTSGAAAYAGAELSF